MFQKQYHRSYNPLSKLLKYDIQFKLEIVFLLLSTITIQGEVSDY